MLNAKPKLHNLKSHPDPRLQPFWNCALLGLLIFPLFPILGALGLFLGLVGTWKQKFKAMIRRPLNWGLAIFCIWLAIASTFAYYSTESWLGLGNFLPFLILFAAFSTLIQTPNQLRQMSWILVITSVPVVILGFGQLFGGWTSSGSVANLLGWTLDPTGNPPGRMASAFMYANILAAYLTTVFILALGLSIEAWRLHPPAPSSQVERGTKGARFFLTVVVIGNAIALILTNSRNGWAIAVFACLAYALYLGWRWVVAAVAGVAGGVLWSAFGPDPVRQWLRGIVPAFFWARLTDQLHPDRPVALMRITQWRFVGSMIQQRPWTGWGLRNFTPLYEAQMQLWLGHPHSLFLMFGAEIGIPATLFFCGLVGWILAKSVLLLQNWSSNPQDRLIFFSYLVAFGGFILFNTVDVTLFDLRVNTLGWLVLAAISGVVSHHRNAIAVKIFNNPS